MKRKHQFYFIYRGNGAQGNAVLRTVYANGICSKKWGTIEKQGQAALDKAVKQGLENKFNKTDIPEALQTVYKYWDEGAL